MRTFTLTPQIAAQCGGPILCLDPRAIGRTFRLFARRPGPERNIPLRKAEVIGGDGQIIDVAPAEPICTRVDIRGVIEQRAMQHDPSGSWCDGHDAIAERLCAALEAGDVLLVIDSPGGAHAGLAESVARVVKAKEEHGRRITGYADEMIGSAAYWWAACVCDEIYGPEAMIVGSIGSRAMHVSFAGELEAAGVAATYFAWPGPGKVAFAPELPLSEIGQARGERDTAAAGEAFAAAVGAARPALSRDVIVELDADALSGQAAVDIGLVDGVASIDDVTEYALTQAGAAEAAEDQKMTTQASNRIPNVRAEGDEPKDPDKEPEGTEPSSACKACGSANEQNAKFCDQCGASMAAERTDAEGDEPEPEEEMPDSDRAGAAKPPMATGGPAAKSYASVAEVFGLQPGASALAIKSAAIALRSVVDKCMAATGTSTTDALVGAVIAHAGDAKRMAEVEGKMRAMTAKAEWRERMDLLRKLSSAGLPGYTRGDLLVDVVNETTGQRTIRPAQQYAEMKLGTLRGLVTAKLKNAAPQRSPFEPSRESAEVAHDVANVSRIAETPAIKQMAARSTASAETLARTEAALRAAGAIS